LESVTPVEDAGSPCKKRGLQLANIVHQRLYIALPVSNGTSKEDEHFLEDPVHDVRKGKVGQENVLL
jgi:hypothetical protein